MEGTAVFGIAPGTSIADLSIGQLERLSTHMRRNYDPIELGDLQLDGLLHDEAQQNPHIRRLSEVEVNLVNRIDTIEKIRTRHSDEYEKQD